jgi:hypothetical protein
MEKETAGDPVSGCRWTRKTTEKIAEQLKKSHIEVSANTVARLLKKMNYHLRVNLKCIESGLKNPPDPYVRNLQYQYIVKQWNDFASAGLPVISVDSKSRELIGPFCRPGKIWSTEPIRVLDHDFPSDADGVGIPYGVYDCIQNRGFVSLGTTYDTAEFSVNAIYKWWLRYGRTTYSEANQLLILADCGGSNSYRTRLWKYQVQTALCNRAGLTVKVCHYPPGSSKWNPIEHRMFSVISNNWKGMPLLDHETMLKYIRTSKTKTGLRITAELDTRKYRKGIKISNEQMASIKIKNFTQRPKWNYAISPNKM